MKRILTTLLAACALHAGGEEYIVYFRHGTDTAAVARKLSELRRTDPQAECRFVVLVDEATTLPDAINSANAIKAGVTELPSLVIADAQGAYAVLPVAQVNAASLATAREAATAPDRDQLARRRNFDAQQYLLFARMALVKPLEGDALQQCIGTCRALMEHPFATPADKQRLGLRCLYPLLMQEYASMYRGAHTPASEAKLLEAIAALEAARDLDRNTETGKQAFAERERLRTARRQARTME